MNSTQIRIDTARTLLAARMDGCKKGTYGKNGRCVPAKKESRHERESRVRGIVTNVSAGLAAAPALAYFGGTEEGRGKVKKAASHAVEYVKGKANQAEEYIRGRSKKQAEESPKVSNPKIETGSGGQKFFFKRNGLSI